MRFLVSIDGLLPCASDEESPPPPQSQLETSVQISGCSLHRIALGTFGVPYHGRDALWLEDIDALRTFGHAIAQQHPAMEAAGVGTSVPPVLPEQTRKANKEAKSMLGRLDEGASLGDAVVDAFGLKLRAQAVISLRLGYSDQMFRPFNCLMADCNQGQVFGTVGDWLMHECGHTRQTDLAGIIKLKHTRSLFLQALLSAPLAVRQEFTALQAREFQTVWRTYEEAFTTTTIKKTARGLVFRTWE